MYKDLVHTSKETHFPLQKPPTGQCCLEGKKLLFIVRNITNTQIHSAGRIQSFGMLEQVVHIVTSRLLRVKFMKIVKVYKEFQTFEGINLPRYFIHIFWSMKNSYC
jgi:hypothetical protein